MKTKHARNLANVQLNPLDFERLTESQMEFKGQNWEVQEFRFDQEMNFNHEYIFWCESYAALVLATHFLDQVGHSYSIAYDSGSNNFENVPLAAVATSGDYNDLSNLPTIPTNLDDLADVNAPTPSNGQVLSYNSTSGDWEAVTPASGGSVTSVGLTMPAPTNAAFSVSGSPVTTSGTLAVAANGTVDQYIDGTGALRTLPCAILCNFCPYCRTLRLLLVASWQSSRS